MGNREQPVDRLVLMVLVSRARQAAAAGDLATLRATARDMLAQLNRRGGAGALADADERELDRIYDTAFPLTDPADPGDVFDAPWPTTVREEAAEKFADEDTPFGVHLNGLVDAALDRGDRKLLRVLAVTPLGDVDNTSQALIADALQAAGELDDELVGLLAEDPYLCRDLAGHRKPIVAAATADRFRPACDERLWQLTSAPDADWDRLVSTAVPRGLRFVLRGLDFTGNWRVARHLGAAELTPAERAELIEQLREQPRERQEAAFTMRLAAGDAHVLLPLLGLAGAERLLRLIQAGQAPSRVVRNDRAAILAAAAEVRPADAERLLKLAPNDVVAAALGLRRKPIMTRVEKWSPVGITAYGMLPPGDGETVLDRWVALRELRRRAEELFPAPERRRQHAIAVDVALDHLAQVGGYADAAALDAAGEAYSPTPEVPVVSVGAYTAAVGFQDAEAAIVAVKGGRALRSVPKAVRDDPGYAALRERQELMRGEAARLCGRLRRLVATGEPLPAVELARLRATTAGAGLLPLLVWQDVHGRFGLLGDVDVAGPVVAAHPAVLAAAGLLGHWQAEAARLRLCQPVPQLFREWYAPTPEEALGQATRFTGRVIGGGAAVRELASRGWRLDDAPSARATRRAGAHTMVLHGAVPGCWGAGDIGFVRLEFADGAGPVAAGELPPAVFSEALRDLERAARAGRRSVGDHPPGLARSRAELLTAVLGRGGSDRIALDGDTAVVSGSRATYRVHLGTEAVTVNGGRRPRELPYGFGEQMHRALYRPVADQSPATTRLLSRVLWLAEDEQLDRSVLDTLGLATSATAPCPSCGRVHAGR
ncbi:hypothetical protein CS0771_44300 [Catellatospora sp. IY07-71]|uniref:DUF4132 domain-containing protein n=1 Tax=Catellatospora sp. IY07-71 TaxID=2728827 RepID=UPI001BB3DFB5|nr:DUF4132 domain-containing protein [Catellatospora sp. IY07-71]BCJ74886.1 hypothetical protein CS0771_44300 [Catellatospora sp. IY07-71]